MGWTCSGGHAPLQISLTGLPRLCCYLTALRSMLSSRDEAVQPPLIPAVLKNLTNLFTLGGDYALYGRTYKANVWACVGLMLLSAICGGATDLSFNAVGYGWQVCFAVLLFVVVSLQACRVSCARHPLHAKPVP